jgi:hypothetical protein
MTSGGFPASSAADSFWQVHVVPTTGELDLLLFNPADLANS